MSDRPEAKELETYDFDLTKLPVGTKITDNRGVERIIRQHFTDPAGPYTWATQARRTSRGMRYGRDGVNLNGNVGQSILWLQTAVLPAKVDGGEIDLLWLPVGTRFKDGNGHEHELGEVQPADQSYPLVAVNGRTWAATGRYYARHTTSRRRKADIVIGTIVLPRRQRLPMAGEFTVPVAVATVKASMGEPAPAFTEPKPEPQPEDKTITNINDLNSWEW